MARIKPLVRSIWEWEGVVQGVSVWKERQENVVTDEGLNKLLNVMFGTDAKVSGWYLGLISNGTASQSDTYSSRSFTEGTAYTEGSRQEFRQSTAGTGSNKSISNASSRGEFTMSTAGTIFGGMLVGGTAGTNKGDTTSGGMVLYSSSPFSAPRVVVDTEVVKLTVILVAGDNS